MKLGLTANHRRRKSPGSAQFVTPTATTYLSHFGFYDKPFNIIPEPKFLWLGERYRTALKNLRDEIVRQNGPIVITGEVGTGKSTLASLLVNELKNLAVPAKVSCPNVGLFDMCKLISTAFRISGDFADPSAFLPGFESFLRESFSAGKKSVLVFDEAQRLTWEQVLDLMRLSDLGENDTKWLSLVFVGQNEFNERLEEESYRVLWEKVALHYEVPPFNLEETKEYIFHRLTAAQGQNGAQSSPSPENGGRYIPRRTISPPPPKEIFPPEALKEVFFLSKGIPRLINNICDFALLSTYFEGGKVVLPKTVKNCVQKLNLPADFTEREAKRAEGSSRTERKSGGPEEEDGDAKKVQRLWAGTDKKAWIMPFSTAAILVIVFFGILFFFSEEGSLLQKFFFLNSKEISRTILPVLPPQPQDFGRDKKSIVSSAVEASPSPDKVKEETGSDASPGPGFSEKTVTPEKAQAATPPPEKVIPIETLKEGPPVQSAAPEKIEAKLKAKTEALNIPSAKAPPNQKSSAAAAKAENLSPLGSRTPNRPRQEAKGAADFHEPSSPFAESKGEKPAAILPPIPQVKPSEPHPKVSKEIEPDKVIDYLLEKRSRKKQ